MWKEFAEEEIEREKKKIAELKENARLLEAKMRADEEQLRLRMNKVAEAEQHLVEREREVVGKQKEVDDLKREHFVELRESKTALATAKRIEQDHNARVNELQDQLTELALQRKAIAEARKHAIDTQPTTQPSKVSDLSKSDTRFNRYHLDKSPIKYPIMDSSLPLNVTNSNNSQQQQLPPNNSDYGVLTMSMLSSVNENASLWKQTAEKDQSFLEDEQFFLQSLKHTPYHGAKSKT